MTKVAIIIPTMNRPDFILRQFEFYELVDSPHPVYILDSSNEENAEKIKNGIKKFKKFNIVYQWASLGKDRLYSLLPLVKEKYCIQMGDDDLVIPKMISECADFLENHPDYATCAGKQVNIRFRKQDYIKPYGLVERQTLPLGRSIEDEDMLVRVKNFWANPNFVCFSVRRTEVEIKIRDITKYFSFMEYLTEFVIWSVLVIYGKAKVLDELGYIMQISDNRYDFVNDLTVDYMLSPSTNEKWRIVQNELAEILQKCGKSKEESSKIAKWIFILYLAKQFAYETNSLSIDYSQSTPVKQSLSQKIRRFAANSFLKKIYRKFKPSRDVTDSGSKYFRDFKIVKDFLEKNEAMD